MILMQYYFKAEYDHPNPQNDQFDINETGYKTSHTAVRKARRFAVQGLYEWLMTDYRFAKQRRDLLGVMSHIPSPPELVPIMPCTPYIWAIIMN